jgi:uncharacterized integral membrane protein
MKEVAMSGTPTSETVRQPALEPPPGNSRRTGLSHSGGIEATGPAETALGRESRRDRFRRKAQRMRLHLYAFAALALLVYLIALAGSSTRHVKVDWVFGSSSVSLVWLVLFTAAILGWLVGILMTALFVWRTRAPRPSD